MNVRRIGFLATRTTNYQPTADFFRDVLDRRRPGHD